MAEKLAITVLDDTRYHQHAGSCGMGCVPPETWEFLQKRLQERYEGTVALEYVDLSQPGGRGRHPGLEEQITARNLALPVVAIDGAVRLSGMVDYRTLSDVIEVEWEMRHGPGV
ncbi:MAG: DUF1462 family protein [Chloroflexi bacterium]|nr:DUF1462 family protein [Chloroflexota bacterium]